MKHIIRRFFIYSLAGVLSVSTLWAQEKTEQEKKAEYRAVVTQRAEKIVNPMALADAVKETEVVNIIAQQYIDLNTIHDERNAAVKQVKENNKANKEKVASSVKKLEAKADKKLNKLHKKYVAKLNKRLAPEQVEAVKNGMTYGVLPITYKGYLEMLPNLTGEQKSQILVYLTEARELAMDAESSEKKHGWFGKYKGRINNYLSAAGYDMNKASKEWQQRIRDEEARKKALK